MSPFRMVFALTVCLAAFGPARAGDKKALDELNSEFFKGRALDNKGQHREAIPFYERAAELAPSVFGAEHVNTAAILNTLGSACIRSGEVKKAAAAFEAALKVREKILAKDDPMLAQSLVNLANVYRRLGRFAEAEPLFLRGLKIEEAKLGKDHQEVLITLNNLAVLYLDMGRVDEAEPILLRCLRATEERVGKDHPEVASGLTNLAALCLTLGRNREAEAHDRRCIGILEKAFGKDHRSLETPLNNLGQSCYRLGKLAEAEAHLMRSLRLREARLPKDHADLAPVLNNLALLYMDSRRPGLAESFFLRSLSIQETQLGKDHYDLTQILNNLGSLYHSLGRHKEAEASFLRSLQICETALGKEHHMVSPTLSNLAALYSAQQRFEQAEPLLLRALKISEKKLGKGHPDVSAATHNLASVYVGLKRYDEALGLYAQSMKLAESIYGADHPILSSSYFNVGDVYARMGRFKEAEEHLLRALGRAEEGAEESSAASLIYRRLGDVKRLLGRHKEAVALHDKSMRLYQKAIDNVFAFSTEQAMHAYLEDTRGSVPSLLTAAAASPENGAGVALHWMLQRKGIVLETVRRFRQTQELLASDDPLSRRVAEYRALKQKLADAALKPPGKDAERARAEMEAWRKELSTLERELHAGLAKKLPAGAEEATSVEAVRKRLPAGSALVDFVRCPLSDSPKKEDLLRARYFAFVLLPDDATPRLLDLGDAAPIDKAVAGLRQEFLDFQEKLKECESDDEAKALEKAQEKQFHKTGKALHARVFAPLEKSLGAAKMIYLAPDGDLNRLPFEALVDEKGKYLIERYQFAYLSSGRDLLRPEATPAKGTVVFANPDFRLDPEERKGLAAKLLGKGGKEIMVASRGPSDTRSVGWKALPGAAAEAKDIEKLLSGGDYGPVRSFGGPEALEEMLKSLPPPRVLHLATHGFFIDHDPDAAWKEGEGAGWARGRLKQMDNPLLRSGIVLAGANTVGEKGKAANVEDGWVTAEEIALMNLRGTELVVLSACQTGLGDLKTGEGVSGLRWAFLYAEARTLVTSLFEVPDTETRDLMKQFYSRLKSEGKLAALHGAQRALIEQRRGSHGAAHPFFWASFVLVGDPK